MCDNSNLKTIQKFPFLMPNYKFNPYVNCKDLPEVNLRPWTDYGNGPDDGIYEDDQDELYEK